MIRNLIKILFLSNTKIFIAETILLYYKVTFNTNIVVGDDKNCNKVHYLLITFNRTKH